MKYIKTFEIRTTWNPAQEGVYWKIRTDTPYYQIGLDKIKMPDDIKIDYLDSEIRSRYFTTSPFVFISKRTALYSPGDLEIEFEWSWSLFESNLIKQKLKNMGEVEITSEDLEEWKFKNTVNKYNL
jgi:hypothetical protein